MAETDRPQTPSGAHGNTRDTVASGVSMSRWPALRFADYLSVSARVAVACVLGGMYAFGILHPQPNAGLALVVGLGLLGAGAFAQFLFQGGVILVAVAVDSWTSRARSRSEVAL